MLPSIASPGPSQCPIKSAHESSGASQQWWPIGRPPREINGVKTAPSKFMPLYWENAQGELWEVRHDGNRDDREYDDHHHRSGYASQNTLEVDHGVLLGKIIQDWWRWATKNAVSRLRRRWSSSGSATATLPAPLRGRGRTGTGFHAKGSCGDGGGLRRKNRKSRDSKPLNFTPVRNSRDEFTSGL